ncbi:MAG: organic solvent tolerance protein [Bdellovibrionota bacterium]
MKQIILIAALVLLSTSAFAKDLNHRLGIGYANQMSVDVPSIQAKYWVDPDLGFSVDLGIKTGDAESAFGIMAKAYKVIFPEENLNFYMGGGAGLISQKISVAKGGDGKNDSGFELMTFVGAEFFLPGLESLAFSFEAGVGVVSIRSDSEFRTIGHSPLNAGMIFYF